MPLKRSILEQSWAVEKMVVRGHGEHGKGFVRQSERVWSAAATFSATVEGLVWRYSIRNTLALNSSRVVLSLMEVGLDLRVAAVKSTISRLDIC